MKTHCVCRNLEKGCHCEESKIALGFGSRLSFREAEGSGVSCFRGRNNSKAKGEMMSRKES